MSRSSEFWPKLKWKLCLPEYLHRPQQIVRRVKRKLSQPDPYEVVRLPWGLDLRIKLPELISNALWYKGIYDITSSETIWRLLDEGEFALDIGANVGYITSLMAARVGKQGKVMAFEPHPVLFQELSSNVDRWSDATDIAEVEVKGIALSDKSGTAGLYVPADWESNRGVAALARGDASSTPGTKHIIDLERLDELLTDEHRIGLAKIDVEGHEEGVLRGAENLLRRRAIRDIVFEDVAGYPSPAMQMLEGFGYSLFSLAKGFNSPHLRGVDRAGVSPRDDPNYLATLEPVRALQRINEKGWQVLREV